MQMRNQPHPRGLRKTGSCAYLECTEEATQACRVTAGASKFVRTVVDVCDSHAQALDSGAPIFIEFTKG